MIATDVTNVTTRATVSDATVLSQMAERWRSAGIFLSLHGMEGQLLWQDPRMPGVLAACLRTFPIAEALARKSEHGVAAPAAGEPMPGVTRVLSPILRRKRATHFLGLLARTGTVTLSEELQRFAGVAQLDARALVAQARGLACVSPEQLLALAEPIRAMYDDLRVAGQNECELADVTGQLSSAYEEITLLHKISSGMRFTQRPEDFLNAVFNEIQNVSTFRGVAVGLTVSPEATTVAPAISVGNCPPDKEALMRLLAEPIRAALESGEMVICNDVSAEAKYAALALEVSRFVCVPMKREKRMLGAIIAIDRLDNRRFDSVDLKLLGNVGSQCGIFLENVALYQDMRDLFMGTLHALVHSIDAKDAYTRGHSQRVAELSRMLARKIGLAEPACERIYLSGLLHDVGKIGVPEAVLVKAGRLTDEEFAAIRKHPAIGAEILGNIRQLADIIPGVLHHHERWDGRGYPDNLAGENIPLLGRIIGLADSFDAMASTRTYRPSRPLNEVIEEIKRCAGSQFDPALTPVFITLDLDFYAGLLEQMGRFNFDYGVR